MKQSLDVQLEKKTTMKSKRTTSGERENSKAAAKMYINKLRRQQKLSTNKQRSKKLIK